MNDIREIVKQKYGAAIARKTSCGCSESNSSCCGGQSTQAITGNLYHNDELKDLPSDMIATSFGCGNPTALTELYAGETVLDLGSGAGLDVLLSAKRVGPQGKAYGLDMTDEMLAQAKKNQELAGAANVEFLKGHIEDIPLPDHSVDVVISNCVINLSPDKGKVLRECSRVLRPGGRFAVADIIVRRDLPDYVQQNLAAWAGCIAGAVSEAEYREKLTAAGFEDIEVQVTRVYDLAEIAEQIYQGLVEVDREALQNAIVSAFVRARKPKQILQPGVEYHIRPGAADDAPAIVRLLQKSGLTGCGVEQNVGGFLVADRSDTGEIAGVIGLEAKGRQGLLRSLAVSPEWRKAGVAAALLKEATAMAKDQGVKNLYLLTDTAEGYLAKFGFRTIERRFMPEELLGAGDLQKACSGCKTCMTMEL